MPQSRVYLNRASLNRKIRGSHGERTERVLANRGDPTLLFTGLGEDRAGG